MAAKLTPTGLAGLHDAATRHVASGSVPDLAALVAHGDQVHVETLGVLAIGGPPVRRDSLFRIASMTKPVTGAATLALIEEGRIGLHEPVETLLPELASRRVLRRTDGPLDDTVPASRPITTRDLLTFTLGFGAVTQMWMGAEQWPIQAAVDELNLAAANARPGTSARSRHLDSPVRVAAAASAAWRAVDVQHRSMRAERAAGARRRAAVRRGAAYPDFRAAGYGRHRILDRPARPAR